MMVDPDWVTSGLADFSMSTSGSRQMRVAVSLSSSVQSGLLTREVLDRALDLGRVALPRRRTRERDLDRLVLDDHTLDRIASERRPRCS